MRRLGRLLKRQVRRFNLINENYVYEPFQGHFTGRISATGRENSCRSTERQPESVHIGYLLAELDLLGER